MAVRDTRGCGVGCVGRGGAPRPRAPAHPSAHRATARRSDHGDDAPHVRSGRAHSRGCLSRAAGRRAGRRGAGRRRRPRPGDDPAATGHRAEAPAGGRPPDDHRARASPGPGTDLAAGRRGPGHRRFGDGGSEGGADRRVRRPGERRCRRGAPGGRRPRCAPDLQGRRRPRSRRCGRHPPRNERSHGPRSVRPTGSDHDRRPSGRRPQRPGAEAVGGPVELLHRERHPGTPRHAPRELVRGVHAVRRHRERRRPPDAIRRARLRPGGRRGSGREPTGAEPVVDPATTVDTAPPPPPDPAPTTTTMPLGPASASATSGERR